jgi:hypothetical protein
MFHLFHLFHFKRGSYIYGEERSEAESESGKRKRSELPFKVEQVEQVEPVNNINGLEQK